MSFFANIAAGARTVFFLKSVGTGVLDGPCRTMLF